MAQNRAELRDRKLFYPITISSDKKLYRTFESHHLLTYSWAGWQPFDRFEPAEFFDRANRTATRYKLHTMLLSAENTYWLPRQIVAREKPAEDAFWGEKRDYVKRIHRDLKQFDTKIVIYLRRQDRWIESWYNQQIKNGNHLSRDMLGFVDHHHYLMDYGELLRTWSDVFGKENVIVRIYEKGQLPNGLFSDFMESSGTGSASDFPLKKKARFNAQLSRDAMEFLNICNELPMEPQDRWWFRILIRRITNQFESQLVWHDQALLTAADRIEVLKRYDDMNAQVAREFLGRNDGRLFFEPWPDASAPEETYPGLRGEYLLQMLMQVIIDVKKGGGDTESTVRRKWLKAVDQVLDAVPRSLARKYRRWADERYWDAHIWEH